MKRPDDGLSAHPVHDLPQGEKRSTAAARSCRASPTNRFIATRWASSRTAPGSLARVLVDLGIEPGDRVATLGWNHGRALEALLRHPAHPRRPPHAQLRLHPDELAYIVNHAQDKLPARRRRRCCRSGRQIKPLVDIKTVVVVGATKPVAGGLPGIRIAAGERGAGHRLAGARGKRRRRHVLHDGHHRQAERRPLLAPRARAPHLRPRAQFRHEPQRARHDHPRRPDVSRQRVGTPLRRG
jgi:hypothetical protein